jgi:hypothetical protein
VNEPEFIFEYFKADLDTGAGSYNKMMAHIKLLKWNEIKPYILDLKYFYFLKTSYWRIISDEIKRRSGWMCTCGSRENLQVHHTEEGNLYHGEEHLMKGLECVCQKCHDKIHGVSVKNAEKKRRRNNKKEYILSQLPFYPKRIGEGNVSGSSFVLTRKFLEELEHERKIIIERSVYDEWKIHRCT